MLLLLVVRGASEGVDRKDDNAEVVLVFLDITDFSFVATDAANEEGFSNDVDGEVCACTVAAVDNDNDEEGVKEDIEDDEDFANVLVRADTCDGLSDISNLEVSLQQFVSNECKTAVMDMCCPYCFFLFLLVLSFVLLVMLLRLSFVMQVAFSFVLSS